MSKKISFLATGAEIVYGDIHERNMHTFSKVISEGGGVIYQHIACTDSVQEITAALHYLLLHSDAIIITGGLGPTSDDRTRFALSEVLKEELIFKDVAWQHIAQRLKRFGLEASSAHRQQALFPASSELIPNHVGTAYGCFVAKNNKLIFMLPGPPPENNPMFTDFVLPKLTAFNYFTARKIYRWLTLGLVEGDIAPKIDSMVQTYAEIVETGFRWSYPYLEIKIINDSENNISPLIDQVNTKLAPYTVSQDKKLALEVLKERLIKTDKNIYIIDHATKDLLAKKLSAFSQLTFVADQKDISEEGALCFIGSVTLPQAAQEGVYEGRMTLHCQGLSNHTTLVYEHSLTTLYRSVEVYEFAVEYFMWQLAKFIGIE